MTHYKQGDVFETVLVVVTAPIWIGTLCLLVPPICVLYGCFAGLCWFGRLFDKAPQEPERCRACGTYLADSPDRERNPVREAA